MEDGRMITGIPGLIFSMLLAFAMGVVAYLGSPFPEASGCGFLYRDPEGWGIPSGISFFLEWIVLVISTIAIVLLKGRFNIIPTLTKLPASIFILMAGADPRLSTHLCSASLFALANIIALWLLFSRYGKQRTEEPLFFIALIFSAGSMYDYAFLPMIPVYVISAGLLKLLTIRSLSAMILGVSTPWWIIFGLNFPTFPTILLPDWGGVFSLLSPQAGLASLIMVGFCTVAGTVFALSNSISMMSAGTATRHMMNAVGISAFTVLILTLLSITGFTPYIAALYLFFAFEAGYFSSSHSGSGRVIWIAVAFLYTLLFVMDATGII